MELQAPSDAPSTKAEATMSLIERLASENSAVSRHESIRVESEGFGIERLVVMDSPYVRDDERVGGNEESFVDIVFLAVVGCAARGDGHPSENSASLVRNNREER